MTWAASRTPRQDSARRKEMVTSGPETSPPHAATRFSRHRGKHRSRRPQATAAADQSADARAASRRLLTRKPRQRRAKGQAAVRRQSEAMPERLFPMWHKRPARDFLLDSLLWRPRGDWAHRVGLPGERARRMAHRRTKTPGGTYPTAPAHLQKSDSPLIPGHLTTCQLARRTQQPLTSVCHRRRHTGSEGEGKPSRPDVEAILENPWLVTGIRPHAGALCPTVDWGDDWIFGGYWKARFF